MERSRSISGFPGNRVAYEIVIKSKVQSQGTFEGISMMAGIIVLGVIVISIVGGGFSFKWVETKERTDIGPSVKTDGLIEKIRQALNSKTDRKLKRELVKKAMTEMKISTPEELASIMDKLNKKP